MSANDDKIEIENFTSPQWRGRVDRAKYEAMRAALLAVLPKTSPGLTRCRSEDSAVAQASRGAFSGR